MGGPAAIRAAVLGWALASASGPPGDSESYAVVGLADCGTEVVQALRALRAGVQAAGVRALSEAETEAVAAGGGTSALGKARERLEALRRGLADLELERAGEALRALEPQIDRLEPCPAARALSNEARLLAARLALQQLRSGDARAAFARILAVEPRFALEAVAHPPSLRRSLEQARHALADAPRHRLRVSSTQLGQPVFVDHVRVATTPAILELPAGSYSVAVGTPPNVSFRHPVRLEEGDAALELDAELEARLRRGASGTCFAGHRASLSPTPASHAAEFSAAFARAAGVTRLVVVGPDREAPGNLVLSLHARALGRELRRISAPARELTGDSAAGLARRLLEDASGTEESEALPSERSGRSAEGPIVVHESARTSAPLVDGAAAQARGSRPELLPPPSSSETVTSAPSGTRWTRIAAWTATAAACVLGAVAAVEHLRLRALEREVGELAVPGTDGAIAPADLPRKLALERDAADARRLRNATLVGLGAATGAAFVTFWAPWQPQEPATPAGRTGAVGVTVTGDW